MRKNLTARTSGLFGWAAASFLLGLALGNVVLYYSGMLAVSVLLIGLALPRPGGITVERQGLPDTVWTDEEVEITLRVTVERGMGGLLLHDPLPSIFELTDGSNFRVLWKGPGRLEREVTYRVRCVKRGVHEFPGTAWDAHHVIGLKSPLKHQGRGAEEVLVRPRAENFRSLRGVRGMAFDAFPRGDRARLGVETTDFREIRTYEHGDPLRKINWKATARFNGGPPLVNDYETEGEKVVWVMLDGSEEMEVGSSTENVLESAVRGARAVSNYFLDQGFAVGLTLYNNDAGTLLPEKGDKQSRDISMALSRLESSEDRYSLMEAVEDNEAFLERYSPYIVVISRVRTGNEELPEGFRRLRSIVSRPRQRDAPLSFVDVLPYSLNPSAEDPEGACLLLDLQNSDTRRRVRGLGVSVTAWDPVQESFSKHWMKHVGVFS